MADSRDVDVDTDENGTDCAYQCDRQHSEYRVSVARQEREREHREYYGPKNKSGQLQLGAGETENDSQSGP